MRLTEWDLADHWPEDLLQTDMKRFIWLILLLATCTCRNTALTPAEYYNLGRYARLDGDWSAAVGYFEKALDAAEWAGDDYYRGYACQQLAAMWILAGENAIALSYSITAVAALEACGETAGAFLSQQIIKDCEASPVQKAAEVKPVVEGCAAAAEVARNGRHGPMGIQQQ